MQVRTLSHRALVYNSKLELNLKDAETARRTLSMFKSLKRLVYQVPNLNQARQWYNAVLDTEPIYDSPFGAIYKIGDCSLSLVPTEQPLSPDTGRISAFWEVDDVDAEYRKLIDAGAAPHTEAKNIISIRTARVIDPFGNIIGLSGKATGEAKRSIDEQPSETALNVALCRALAAGDEGRLVRGPDHLAHLFIPEEKRKSLQDADARTWVINRLITPALYGYLIARTAYFDRIYESALRGGVPQLVLLGAGYDTRPYRFGNTAQNTRIFEVDSEPTQQRKREILARACVPVPTCLSFVSVNFAKGNLEEALARAGYDDSLKTLFLWEGVTYYLTALAVENTLRFVTSHSPSGSTLCFDYMTENLESAHAAEPFQFWIEPDRLFSFLSERGFALLEHLGAKEMESQFLMLPDGSLSEKTLTRFRLVQAITV